MGAKQPRPRLRLRIMAPVSDQDVVEKQVKEAIQDLYQIMVQTNAYDLTSRPSNQVLEAAFKQLDSQLLKIHNTASQRQRVIEGGGRWYIEGFMGLDGVQAGK